MKKTLSIILAVAMCLALVACGSENSTPSAPETNTEPEKTSDYEWPTQPVNVICPASAGGGTDNWLRIMNEYFTKKTGQPFVISNVNGYTGYEQAHMANTDGYDFICGTTLIFTSDSDGTFDYDWKDYEMVMFHDAPNNTCFAVRADSPYQTINDLLDAAKADPSSVTGGISMGGQPYMCALALQDALGFELYLADVGNTAERNTALLGGQVDWILSNTPTVDPYVKSGDFRVLAVCGDERYPMNPDVPTFVDCGIDFVFPAQPLVWLAPKGTPTEACEAFNQIISEICSDPVFISDVEAKLNQAVYGHHSIEESIEISQEYDETMTPYAVKK